MPAIQFSAADKSDILQRLTGYFDQELGRELGQFEAEFLLDFISEKIGAYYYNQGISDARSLLEQQFDNISDAFYQIEQPLA